MRGAEYSGAAAGGPRRLGGGVRLPRRHGPEPGLRDARGTDAARQVGAALRESTFR